MALTVVYGTRRVTLDVGTVEDLGHLRSICSVMFRVPASEIFIFRTTAGAVVTPSSWSEIEVQATKEEGCAISVEVVGAEGVGEDKSNNVAGGQDQTSDRASVADSDLSDDEDFQIVSPVDKSSEKDQTAEPGKDETDVQGNSTTESSADAPASENAPEEPCIFNSVIEEIVTETAERHDDGREQPKTVESASEQAESSGKSKEPSVAAAAEVADIEKEKAASARTESSEAKPREDRTTSASPVTGEDVIQTILEVVSSQLFNGNNTQNTEQGGAGGSMPVGNSPFAGMVNGLIGEVIDMFGSAQNGGRGIGSCPFMTSAPSSNSVTSPPFTGSQQTRAARHASSEGCSDSTSDSSSGGGSGGSSSDSSSSSSGGSRRDDNCEPADCGASQQPWRRGFHRGSPHHWGPRHRHCRSHDHRGPPPPDHCGPFWPPRHYGPPPYSHHHGPSPSPHHHHGPPTPPPPPPPHHQGPPPPPPPPPHHRHGPHHPHPHGSHNHHQPHGPLPHHGPHHGRPHRGCSRRGSAWVFGADGPPATFACSDTGYNCGGRASAAGVSGPDEFFGSLVGSVVGNAELWSSLRNTAESLARDVAWDEVATVVQQMMAAQRGQGGREGSRCRRNWRRRASCASFGEEGDAERPGCRRRSRRRDEEQCCASSAGDDQTRTGGEPPVAASDEGLAEKLDEMVDECMDAATNTSSENTPTFVTEESADESEAPAPADSNATELTEEEAPQNWADEQALLLNMGFTDREENTRALDLYEGDIMAVVGELLRAQDEKQEEGRKD